MLRLVHIVVGLFGALVFNLGGAAEIDFESPEVTVVPQPDIVPGNTYAAFGVIFSTVVLNAAPVVGELRSLAPQSDQFRLYESDDAISPDQFAGPDEGGPFNDLLMHFTTPITRISVVSDDAGGESPQIIRLIALSQEGADYRVLAFDEGFDDATSSPGNVLELDLGGTSFFDVLFEVDGEQEGFDDLRFTTVSAVPEPAPLALLGAMALSGLLAGLRRR